MTPADFRAWHNAMGYTCDKLTRHAWLGAALLHWATRCAHAALGWSLRAWQLELIEHA